MLDPIHSGTNFDQFEERIFLLPFYRREEKQEHDTRNTIYHLTTHNSELASTTQAGGQTTALPTETASRELVARQGGRVLSILNDEVVQCLQ
jgi:hypothetical protein